MSSKVVIKIVFLPILFSFYSLFPVVKGSNTAVSVEPNASFPAADNDNTMLGFGWFKNGFALEDSTTTCTFDSVYPVSGTVDLNGGTLCLKSDLLFSNITSLQTMGSILGGEHQVNICSSVTYIPTNTCVLHDVTICFQDDIALTNTIIIKGTCTFCGCGNTMDLGANGALVVDTDGTLEIKCLTLDNVGSRNIKCVDDTGILYLNNTTVLLHDDFTFDKGRLLISNEVPCLNMHTFYYESAQTSTILQHSCWAFVDGATLSIGRKSEGAPDPLAFIDYTSILAFDNASIAATKYGIQLAKGRLSFERFVGIDIVSTTSNNGAFVGDGLSEANDMFLCMHAGAVVTHQTGAMIFRNVGNNKIRAASREARLIRMPSSSLFIHQDTTLPSMHIEFASLLVSPIEITSGINLEYNDLTIIMPGVEFDLTARQLNANTYILDGGDSIFFSRGVLPLNVVVQGINNIIFGNGGVSGGVTLQDSNTTLTCSIDGMICTDISLNSGTVILEQDFCFCNGYGFSSTGTVNIASHKLSFGPQDFATNVPLYWESNNGFVDIRSTVALSNSWRFNGACTLEGHGNLLDIENGEIVIEPNSQLTLKDINIKNISGTNIRCVDDTASLVLDGVSWIQNDHFTFGHGSLLITNDVVCLGMMYTFSYESVQTSTILQHSCWKFSDASCLSIGRKTEGAPDPIHFLDYTSILEIDNAYIYITQYGMEFTGGRLSFERFVGIDIVSTASNNGAFVGDGLSEANDMFLCMHAGAVVTHQAGAMIFRNVGNNKIRAASREARLIRTPNSYIYIHTNLDLPVMRVELTSNMVPPLQVLPSVNLEYMDTTVVMPGVEFDLLGRQFSAYVYSLNGNDSIFFSRGILPLYIQVENSGNKIWGNGGLSGQVTLQDDTSELTMNIAGFVTTDILLNGGRIILDQDLYFAEGYCFIGTGTVSVNTSNVCLSPKSLYCDSDIYWDSDGGFLDIHSTLTLSNTWTFSGVCTIYGHGNILDLEENGEIVVECGSSLILKDIVIKDISGTNIRCLDDASVVTLDNVTWMQSDDYEFSTGAFNFKNKNKMQGGNYVFAYQTSMTSVFLSDSALRLDSGFTFSYDPSIVASKDLLEFEDSSAQLLLNGCTLHTTVTGLSLKQGKMCTLRTSYLSSEVQRIDINTVIDEGISFGDNETGSDFICEILNSKTLCIKPGSSLRYKNVESSSWIMISSLSNLFISSGARLYLHQNLNVGAGTVIFDHNTTLFRKSGKRLIGSTSALGTPNIQLFSERSVSHAKR